MGTRHKGPRREVRALDTYIKLMRCADSLEADLKRQLAGWELTLPQLAVLEALYHLGELGQTELCRKMLRTGGSVTSVLGTLERKGWIERERLAADRRVSRVRLTLSGRRLIREVFPDHARRIAGALGALTAAEQEQLARLARKLGRALAAAPPA